MGGYGICFNEWLFDERIKSELALLIYISSLSAKNGYCFATNKHFADKFKVSQVTISRQISKLQKLNFISIKNKKVGSVIVTREITINKLKDKKHDYQKEQQPLTQTITAVNKNDNGLYLYNNTSLNNISSEQKKQTKTKTKTETNNNDFTNQTYPLKEKPLEEKPTNESVSGYGCENSNKSGLKKTSYTNVDLKKLGATQEFIDEFCDFSRSLKQNNGATTDELKVKMDYFAKKIYELESEQEKKRVVRLRYQAFKRKQYGDYYYLDTQNFEDEKEWLYAMPEALRKKVSAVNVENLLFKYFLPYLKAKTGKCVSELELIQIANTLKDYSQLGQVLIVCRCMYGNWTKLKPYTTDPKDKWNDNPIFLYSIKNNEPYFGGFKYEKRWL
ncbi:helix-turn-helix domain-containing protein [Campylobacter ureolyticus]|uniref:helix-turn-helix domain-containing protein n=1 Tax=Campylobacter ureolyticus TaxID=827 RepID=UPI00290756A8|nr:helix-turn-helix domain-containing protein [Campylobacter ureolyticus]MDU7070059.1 helix-turn-helix domain-containing protein [Campylobacter ureolyticus]